MHLFIYTFTHCVCKMPAPQIQNIKGAHSWFILNVILRSQEKTKTIIILIKSYCIWSDFSLILHWAFIIIIPSIVLLPELSSIRVFLKISIPLATAWSLGIAHPVIWNWEKNQKKTRLGKNPKKTQSNPDSSRMKMNLLVFFCWKIDWTWKKKHSIFSYVI